MLFDSSRASSRLDLLYLVASEFNAGLDIDEILDNVLTTLVASMDASGAILLLMDEFGLPEKNLVVSNHETRAYPPQDIKAIFENDLANWVWNNQKGVIIANTSIDERWCNTTSIPELEQAVSAVAVPLHKPPDGPLGVLTLTKDVVDYFDASDLATLTIIADQAAFALTNARLIKAERHRRRIADTLASIARTINSSLNLNKVLNLILEQLALVVDYDSSSILLYDDTQRVLSVQAARGFEDMVDAMKVTLAYNEDLPNYQAILQKQPIVIGDVDQEPNWIKSPSSQQVKSWIGAPLIARNQVVGILAVDSHEIDKYSKENVEVVAAFADHAATAVANAQAVTQLQLAQASYSALFEDSTDMILITDYEGVIHNVNRKGCQILRRPKDAITGLGITFFAPKLKGFLEANIKHLQAWREATIDVDIMDAYRQKIPLEIRVRHIQFGGDERVEWVGRDISARKEAERMRQDLVNMLVHDLRGPLGNLINTIDLIAMMVKAKMDDSNLKRFLEMGRRTGRTLTDMVDSMLDVSRLEQGEVPLQRSPTNLVTLLKEVQEQVVTQAQARQTTLSIGPPPEELSEIFVDNGLMRRVLTNLVSNAIKYSPESAEVTLTIRRIDDKILFTVKDNGPGIAKADQIRIFDKFSRISTAGNSSGVGLGLAFCKLAVEAHQGKIWVESDGISGEGSAFYVSIPLIIDPDEANI